MAKASKKANKIPKAKNPIQQFLIICMLVNLGVLLGLGAVVHFYSSNNLQQTQKQINTELLGKSAQLLLTEKLADIHLRLSAIAQKDDIHNALTFNDQGELQNLEKTYGRQFEALHSLRILPWDQLGTAGIKQKGITLNNNIELMLVSKAGGGSQQISPESYKVGKQQLFSFAQAITANDQVVGVLLLTLKAELAKTLFNKPFFTNNGQLQVVLSGQKTPLFSIGKGQGPAKTFPLSIDGAKLLIKNAASIGKNASQQANLMIVLLAIACIIACILVAVFYYLSRKVVRQDIAAIEQYTESLRGLHKAKPPVLATQELQVLLPTIENLGAKAASSVNEPDNQNPEPKAKPTKKAPELSVPEVVEVTETFAFDSPEIFKNYDIRGDADKQLHDENCELIGQALATVAKNQGQQCFIIGHDSRPSSPRISQALTKGILQGGIDVIDIGEATTPICYFAKEQLNIDNCLMVTGSHNGEDQNGIKITLNKQPFFGDALQQLLGNIELREFSEGQGTLSDDDVSQAYIERISDDIITAQPLKVLLDSSQQLAGDIAKTLFEQCDCEVTLSQAKDDVVNAMSQEIQQGQFDLGIAFDSDADRLMALDNQGNIIAGDKLLMLFAQDIITRNPGASVIYDVKCSREVASIVSQAGGRAIMHKAGHSNIKEKMLETDAIFAGELTGHFYFKERWFGFDDGIYAALRLVELLSASEQSFAERLDELPQLFASPEYYVALKNDAEKQQVFAKAAAFLQEQSGEKVTIDGLRLEFDAGWGLVRPSNTEAALTLRFEAKTAELLSKIEALFKSALEQAKSDIQLPF